MQLLVEEDSVLVAKEFLNVRGRMRIDEEDLRILDLLSTREMGLSEISRALGREEQRVHSRLKKLLSLGVLGKRESKYYLKYRAFGYNISGGGTPVAKNPLPEPLSSFLFPFVSGGKISGLIVVGSPDPHGPYLQRARDVHYVGVLGLFLGRYLEFSNFPVMLDTDIRLERRIGENMLVLGGPVSNLVALDLNEHAPVRYGEENPYELKGRKTYTEDTVGVIQKFPNPFGDSWVIWISGIRAVGTKSAVMALLNWRELLRGYSGGEFWAIVRGEDRDGDGRVDTVRTLEISGSSSP